MSFYMVMPGANTTWRMDPEAFVVELLKRWPDATFTRTNRSAHPMKWRIPFGEYLVEGSFHHSGQLFPLHGTFAVCAEVACWIRSLAPPDQELFLADDMITRHMLLTPDTRLEDVLAELA